MVSIQGMIKKVDRNLDFNDLVQNFDLKNFIEHSLKTSLKIFMTGIKKGQ